MTPEPSSGTSFKGWILGILGAVITAVIIFWVQQQLSQKPAPPPPAHSIVSVNGRVFDRGAKRLLENAVVRLHLASLQEEQRTDSEGRYAFSVEDFDLRQSGSMQIEAAGYKPLTFNLSLQEMSAMQDQFLDVLNPAPPTGAGVAVDGSVGGGKSAVIGKYVARTDIKRMSVLMKHP